MIVGVAAFLWCVCVTACDVAVCVGCQAHLCGMMSDLPDHVNTEQEITETIVQLQNWLEELPYPPTLVTIAR